MLLILEPIAAEVISLRQRRSGDTGLPPAELSKRPQAHIPAG